MSDSEGRPFDEAFLRRLERLTLRTRRVAGLSGGRPGVLRVPAADFVDHRPYSPGDDPRHIHWAAVARHDEVFVKVGRAAQSADVSVMVDVSPSMEVDGAKGRLAVELAVALAWIALHAADRVTVIRFADRVVDTWGPAAGSGRVAGMLAHLTGSVRAAAGATTLQATCRQTARLAPSGGLAIVVSDLWLADDLDAALALLPRPRWDVLLLQVMGRRELEPTLKGAVTVRDAESGEELQLLLDDAALHAYRQALHARLDRLRAVAAGRGARYALIPADWPLERAVVPFLQQRAVLES